LFRSDALYVISVVKSTVLSEILEVFRTLSWTKLSVEERLTILTNIADEKGIVENAVDL